MFGTSSSTQVHFSSSGTEDSWLEGELGEKLGEEQPDESEETLEEEEEVKEEEEEVERRGEEQGHNL